MKFYGVVTTGGSSWQVVGEITKQLEPIGRLCPELGGILVGYGKVSYKRIKEFITLVAFALWRRDQEKDTCPFTCPVCQRNYQVKSSLT